MTHTRYVVKYRYYQYNTGSANNGTFDSELVFSAESDARELKNEIVRVAAVQKNGESTSVDREFTENYISDGYFVGAALFRRNITETRIE